LLRNEIKENTVLISIHYVNSEIGVIQDISEIAKEIRHFRKSNSSVYPLLHTDAVQAMNYLDISNIEKLGVDMMSFNGSKIYGPKGIGVLYKKRNISLAPHIFGGGQEMGLRSGTENVMAIIGLSKALEITSLIREKEVTRLRILQDYIYEEIKNISKRVGFKMLINGDMEKRIPNNINISIEGISSELMVILLDACDVAISEKSACKSDDDSDSHVISALRKNDFTKQAIRISMGRNTTLGDIKYFLSSLEQILGKYKSFVI
jgi:cysteine desulfurase